MPRQDYEGRQERRRERLEERALKQHDESARRFSESDRMAKMMNGQPVLIGHHSEKRHRRDIDRMWNHSQKGAAAHNNAQELERRADSVGKAGISSDDPNAPDKLAHKLASLERHRDQYKAVNAAWRKAGRPLAYDKSIDHAAWDAAFKKYPDLDVILTEALNLKRTDFWNRPPYSYQLTNIGSEIRRITKRLASLKTAEAEPDREPIEGEGWKIWEDREENRLFIAHDTKPSADVRTNLKRYGFRWNRYAGAWSRMLNGAAWANAEFLAEKDLLN